MVYYQVYAKKPVYNFLTSKPIIAFTSKYAALSFSKSGKYRDNVGIREYKTVKGATLNDTIPLFDSIEEYNEMIELHLENELLQKLTKLISRDALLYDTAHLKHKVLKLPRIETKYVVGEKVFPNNVHASCDTDSFKNQFSEHFDIPKYSSPSFNKDQWLKTGYVVVAIAIGNFMEYDEREELVSREAVCYYCKSLTGYTLIVCTEENLSKMDMELHKEMVFDCLAEANKGKYDKSDDLKAIFPEQLLKFYYDGNPNTLFGSDTTRASIKYPYVPGIYMKDGVPMLLGWEQNFDGGEEMKRAVEKYGKDILIEYDKLKKIFTNNKFE